MIVFIHTHTLSLILLSRCTSRSTYAHNYNLVYLTCLSVHYIFHFDFILVYGIDCENKQLSFFLTRI